MEAFQCSFCGKPRSQVEKLVSGPRVFICDECINMCVGIIDEERDPEKAAKQRAQVIASEEVQSAFAERDRVQRLLGMWVRNAPPKEGARRRIESAFRDDPEIPASAASILEAARTTSDAGEAESRAIFALNVATTTAVCEDLDAAVSYFEARGHRALERWNDDDGDNVMLRRPDKGFLILVEDLDDE